MHWQQAQDAHGLATMPKLAAIMTSPISSGPAVVLTHLYAAPPRQQRVVPDAVNNGMLDGSV